MFFHPWSSCILFNSFFVSFFYWQLRWYYFPLLLALTLMLSSFFTDNVLLVKKNIFQKNYDISIKNITISIYTFIQETSVYFSHP